MNNALVPGLGGPMGRYAAPRGVWFNPLPWTLLSATALFVALVARHVPCIQTVADSPVNAYIRLCYSDIQSTFLGRNLGLGASPVGGGQLMDSPLVAVLMALTVLIVVSFGGVIGPAATPQNLVDASVGFFAVSAVVLFVCFLVTALAMGRYCEAAPGFRFAWSGWLVAASPVVFAVGLIDWTLLAVALSAVGVLQVTRGRLLEGGIVLGIAASAATMPIAVLLAATTAVALRDGALRGLRVLGPAAATWLAIHLPLLIVDANRVYAYYHGEINADVGRDTAEVAYGSLWYLPTRLGVFREAGPLLFVLLLLALATLGAYLYVRRCRPPIGSTVAAAVLLSVLFGLSFTPQTGLWVLFAALLARPSRTELIAVTATQVAYAVAIWVRLNGTLAEPSTPGFGLHVWYWLAILAHVGVELWLLTRIVGDLARSAARK